MNKTQAWILIVFVGILITLWLIRNGNESNALVNKVVGCYQVCDAEYDQVAGKSESISQALSESDACKNQCNTENGESPSWGN